MQTASAVVVALACAVAGVAGCSSNAALPFDGPPWETGIEVGTTYRYEISTHCGLGWARIDGAWWRTAPPRDDPNPPEGWDDPQRGDLRVETADRAVFDGGPGDPVVFVRTDSTVDDDPSLESFVSCD